jgi:hypothetical protein
MAAKKKASGKKSAGMKAGKASEEKEASQAEAANECDFKEVRKDIAKKVGKSAGKIADEVIKVALTGQLAPAKYLFESVGLFPPTEQETAARPENSLAFTLLRRMGLPTEPIRDDEELPESVPSGGKPLQAKAPEGEESEGGQDKAGGAEEESGEEIQRSSD